MKALVKLAAIGSRAPLVPVYLGGLCAALILLIVHKWVGLALCIVLTAGYVLAKRYGGAE